ncbi:transglycosylase domain-containing protein [Lactococcus garvieae]
MKKDQEQSKERAQARLQAKMEKKRARKTQERRENSPKKPQKPKKVQADAEEGKTTLQTIFSVMRGVVVIFGVLFLLVGVFGAAAGVGYFARLVENTKVPSKEQLLEQVNNIHGVSVMKYSNGENISDVSSDLVRINVASDQISENVKKALIATEDETFKTNNGVVPKAVIRGVLGAAGGGTSSGGSTITQQLVKQQSLGDSVTFQRKASEIVYALQLNQYLSKDEILTDYLNVSPFGRNNQGKNIAGVQAAAKGIFGKSAKDLTVPEAAFIAGLPQSPIVYSPYNVDGSLKSKELLSYGLARQQNVLFNMYRAGYLTQKDYEKYSAVDISQAFLPSQPQDSVAHGYLYNVVYSEALNHVYDYLIKRDKVSATDQGNDSTKQKYRELAAQALQTGGYTITTTINRGVYEAMQNAVAQYGGILQDGTGEVQAGNVLMDNKTGAVLGFIGGLDYTTNQNNHAFDTTRSPGSSIKPILAYAPAIDLGLIGSASMLSNYPASFSDGTPILHVGETGTGMVSLNEALGVSWNIPAHWTYQAILDSGNSVEPYMKKMGYYVPDYSVESLPLGGGIEPTVVQHTNGYQALANGGVYEPHYVVQSIKDDSGKNIYEHKSQAERVFSQATSTITEDLLRNVLTYDVSRRTTNFLQDLQAINPTLASSVDWTGKTGTSNDYVDGWLMLSTPKVSLGGWIGHDDNTPMGSKTAAVNNGTYMANLVNAIAAADPNVFGPGEKFPDPSKDPDVIKSTVLKSTGQKPGTVTGGNLKNVKVSGETTTSYWAKNGAPVTQFKFGIGGTEANYNDAWNRILGTRK